MTKPSLFPLAWRCLQASEAEHKIGLTRQLLADWDAGELALGDEEIRPIGPAGRPALPGLVHPRELPRRSLASPQGRAALLHAVTHIEFNAVNLALDHAYRFRRMPEDYYGDWLRVAVEEGEHFQLLRDRLRAAGFDYGSFPGHNGLWDMAQRTAGDALERMALVPRALEARGLDVTPGMIVRFQTAGDAESAAALERILRDEVGHVRIGTRWFQYLCTQRGLDPEETYFTLLETYLQGEVRGPVHREARREARFSEAELDRLEGLRR